MKNNYDIKLLEKLVESSTSIRQVLNKLNIKPAGGNYRTIKNYISEYKISTSHFKGQGWSKGNKIGPKKPIEFYFKNKFVQSFKLKKRLLAEGLFNHKCSSCKKTKWLNKKIPLELHHKDGDNSNNEFSNLDLLCPNCHALTDNYRGKNKK